MPKKNRNYATYDALMRHMRKSGIAISGSNQKRYLMLNGYFHGYKGYRYCREPSNRLPFTTFNQIRLVIEFDEAIKACMYSPLMKLETAIKSIACDRIVTTIKSDSFATVYEEAMSNTDRLKRLKVRDRIYSEMTKRYGENSKVVSYYYNQDEYMPLWAIFEELMLGDVSIFIEALHPHLKLSISKELGIPISYNTDGELLPKIILGVKDFRNAIAHNKVVFDGRYMGFKKRNSICSMLENSTGILGIKFQSPIDDIILVIFLMKNLLFSKVQLHGIVSFLIEGVTKLYSHLDFNLYKQVIPADTLTKLKSLKKFISNK